MTDGSHFMRNLALSPGLAVLISACAAHAPTEAQLVRLAVIEVDTSQLEPYNDFLSEEIESSIRLEPGVITLYGVAEKASPHHVTLFETYADSGDYKAHLTTPHFQKYKQGTLTMVKRLELIESHPLLYHKKMQIDTAQYRDLFVRLIKMEIDSNQLERFKKLAQTTMLPALKDEPGVLVMYAVSEKMRPTNISILEVYADREAYENHLTTKHFLKYKEDSRDMVSSLKMIDVKPITLGAKTD